METTPYTRKEIREFVHLSIREFEHLLFEAYREEVGVKCPLTISSVEKISSEAVYRWEAWLNLKFVGFKSDGCTGVPSLSALAACVWHDLLYYVGFPKRLSDLELMYYIRSLKYKTWFSWAKNYLWGNLYYVGTRLFGIRAYNQHCRRRARDC